MAVFTLYVMCLRKIANNLRHGFYKPCRENPFRNVPHSIVNNITSLILERQGSEEFRADDLEQLLTSGNLKKLEISVTTTRSLDALLREVLQVLNFLRTGCQKLEVFNISLFYCIPQIMGCFRVSVAFMTSHNLGTRLRREISEALENVIRSTPNLEDFHCCLSFDLKALRSCQKLRSLRLHFNTEQRWYEFLEEENGHLKANEFLRFFTVCGVPLGAITPYDDVAIILQRCPNLTSLGFIESSGALSQLYRMDKSRELRLRSCYWKSIKPDRMEYPSRISEAVMKCSTIEELEYEGCCLRSIPYLKDLKNLVYLIINLHDNVSEIVFNALLREIGPQLKHLFFHTNTSMDISLLLQNCLNLESLRMEIKELRTFSNPSVCLPKLKHLTLDHLNENVKQIFYLLSNCNELTELFLLIGFNFDDETLHTFLGRNSLSNLKVAYFELCELTEHGFREFLQNTPNLEKVSISNRFIPRNNFQKVASEMKHNVLCNGSNKLKENEFFEKKSNLCGF